MNAAASRPVALSPLHQRHVALGAEMALVDGWQRPVRYAAADEELAAVRSGVGVCDVSPMGKLALLGDGLDALLDSALPNTTPPAVGRAARVDEESFAARVARDEALVTTASSRTSSLSERLTAGAAGCAHVVDVTSALAAVRIAGPRSRDLLAALTELDVARDAFDSGSSAQSQFAEIHGTLVRLDAAGLPAYTLFFGREYGDYMWESIMEAGERYDVTPFGIETLGRLR